MQDDLALAVMYGQDKMLLQGVRCLSWVSYEARNSMYRSLILFSGIHLEGFSALIQNATQLSDVVQDSICSYLLTIV